MQTTDKKMFRDMQEHPEKYSDQQIEAMLDELDRVPDVESAWQKFSAEHNERTESAQNHSTYISLHPSFLKIAASFIGILLVSGIAYAAIHFVRMSDNRKPQNVQTEQPASPQSSMALSVDTVVTDTTTVLQPIVFDNVPLETMLTEIAAFYQSEVSFRNDATRQLRFYFVWKPEDGLDQAIKKLNRFESLSLRLEDNKIIVE